MWSEDDPISDENQIPDVQNVYHKSVGQTSSKVLTGQTFAVLDLNTLVNKRSSPPKTSNHSALISMKSARVGTGTPDGAWIDPCHTDILTESSETEANTSKMLLLCSLVETKVFEGDSASLSTCSENYDQFSQSCNIAVLPQPIDSSDSQTASNDHEDNHRWSVEQVGHSQHINSDELIYLPSAINTKELPELQIIPALDDDTCQKVSLMLDDPESCNDAHDVLVPGCRFRQVIELGKIQLRNLDSKDKDNAVNDLNPDALHITKGEIFLPTMRNDSLEEDLLLTNQKLDYVEETNAVISTNTTYEIDPYLHVASEQRSGIGIDALSEVTEVIANWNLSIKDDDYFQNKAADDECNVEGCPHIEKSWSTTGMMINDLNELQLLTGSPEKLDPVLDHYEEYLPDTLPIKSYVLTEVVYPNPTISPLCNPLFYMKKRTSKCCTPVIRGTTDNILTEGDSTPLTRVKNNQHISKMDQEAGTSMTPVSTTEGVTWMTPMMLLNKSMNTSFIEMGKKSAKDNSSETDSLLWSFSREALCNATQEELLDRLEGTLIVIEVLSRQLQGWQENKVSSKPSEQRECATQTCVTYTSTEEQYYHSLYLKTLSRLQSVQRSQWEEKVLLQHLKVATDTLASHKNEALSAIEYANSLYEVALKDRSNLQQKMSHTRKLLGDHMCFLEKMSKKGKDCLLQRDEMRACMEKAIEAKDVADVCLQDLEIHSSAAITQLRRDLESERLLCESVKEAYKEQRSYNEEVAEFVGKAQSVSSQVEEDRTQLQKQCTQAKELMSRYRHLFEVMKEKTQSALEQYEGIVMERDVAVLENEKLCGYLESMNSQTEQMKLENSRLGSELESLMGTLCTRKVEIEQLKEEKLELEDLLSAKNTSMKLLEKELDETIARGHEYQDRIKHLAGQIVPSLEMDLSKTLNQKQALQKQLEMVAKEHASQITYYTESLEFLEQENSVCREQVAEVESQLRTHHRTVLERNFQCEDLKDTIKDLQKEVNDSQEKLSHSQKEARSRMMKLNKEISDSFMEIFKIKSHMLELMKNLREDTKNEAIQSLPRSQTPGRSLVPSKEEELMTTNISAADLEDQREGIGSKTSAFTLVHPVSPPSADLPQDHLPVVVNELSRIVADVITTSSSAIEGKQQTIQDLKMQISSLKEELQNLRFQHTSEVRMLQEEVGNLRRRNCILDQKINSKEKCISELQEVVNQQEQKILQQFSKSKESEVLIQENAELQLSLKVCEKEVEVLKKELAQNSTEAARNWIQEKLLLHKDLTTLRQKLIDTEYSKSEAIQRLLRHKDILKANQARSDAEVKKLDNVIVRIRQDLLSIPEVVNDCDKLRELMDFLNYGSCSEKNYQ